MELKVWVDGVQRIVCGVTEFTTCQEVVIALAQAIGRTGRYTLIEQWRGTERHLAPHENPVVSLNKWGAYASDVQLVLQRTGPSLSERPGSDGPLQGRIGGHSGHGGGPPERGFYRQSLPPLAKLRPSLAATVSGGERSSLKRRGEPKRKSLTFSGGAKGLRDIFGRSRDSEAAKQQQQQRGGGAVNLNLSRLLSTSGALYSSGGTTGTSSAPGSPSRELGRLVQLQKDKLQALESRLALCESELRDWDEVTVTPDDEMDDGTMYDLIVHRHQQASSLEEEVLLAEQQARRNEQELQEEEFWANELHIEQESERQLREQLGELQGRVRDCDARLLDYLARIQNMEVGLEQERLHQEAELNQQANEEELRVKLGKVRAELEVQNQHTARLENSCRVLDRSLGQYNKRLQEKEQELEQLTKELRQVNLQQFIQQTGTKVTVLPAQPNLEDNNNEIDLGSLKRLGSSRLLPSDLRTLQNPACSGLNPEGIYV